MRRLRAEPRRARARGGTRRSRRPAPVDLRAHAAPGPAHRRLPGAAGAARGCARKPRRLVAAVRHLRVDGAVRAGHAAAALLRRRRPRAEVFTFATRLTRLTRRAGPRAAGGRAGAAPGRPPRTGPAAPASARRCSRSSTGTAARGLARGAVVLDHLRRLGDRRPGAARRARWRGCRGWRTGSSGPTRAPRSPRYRPLVGGMAAAWPYCDAVVSAHRLAALPELAAALADPVRRRARRRNSPIRPDALTCLELKRCMHACKRLSPSGPCSRPPRRVTRRRQHPRRPRGCAAAVAAPPSDKDVRP